MVSSSQIRERIEHYLSGRAGLDLFEDWFVRATWDIHKWGSRSAELLTFAIEELLSEYSSDHMSEVQLRRELSTLLWADNERIAFCQPPIRDLTVETRPVSETVHVSYVQA